MAAGMGRAGHAEEQEGLPEDESEAEGEADDRKGSFAQRFVARREARRARKTGGMSLGDRLRGLVADRPET